ncbi:GAF domain-containing protein [Halonotius terrestris]|uniref:GAF domain-containing protein n=1 Tax=Halonotius terrestris TaxID=2487750 RepID=A0A8J8P8A2_9EURY|nr:bacterio-opsin activator domain-containing protein [Halonotius terrestris]TQQ82715.1 GAF domain-containing protein [Halonotius terrestris]
MDESLTQAPIGVIETTAAGEITAVNDAAAELLETEPAALRETDIRESFPYAAAGTLREAFRGDTPTDTEFEEYYPRLDRWFAVDVVIDDTVLIYVQDRTEYHETDQRADRLERRLDRIQRIETLIATVLQRVIGAADRREVARTVCAQLGGTEGYDFVWVGDRDFRNDRLRVVDTAGSAPELREHIDDALGDCDTLPGQQAVETEATQHVEAVADDAGLPRAVRQAAFGSGLQSCVAVPLTHQGTVYGVLSVYAGREDGFSDGEVAGLETLGRVAGFAIRAIRQEELLVADTVTEITLEIRDETLPLVTVARELGVEFDLDGAVPRGDGAVVCYVRPRAATDTGGHGETTAERVVDPDTIEAAFADDDRVEGVSWVRTDDEPLLQVTVTGETPVTTLVGWGATITDATYTGSTTRLVAETPPDENVRQLLETVDETVAETELIAKSEATPTAEPAAFRDRVSERLTDRQETVLRTAFLAEYFDSPRGSTAEEVADALGITGPTVLYHLRRAERELIEAFLSAGAESEETEPAAGDDSPDVPADDD